MLSPVFTTPASAATGIGLAPVTVHPDFQGQGLSSVLKKRANFGLQNEYGVDNEFMLICFSEHSAPVGMVKYAPEFLMFSV
jgi:hypothetical protein